MREGQSRWPPADQHTKIHIILADTDNLIAFLPMGNKVRTCCRTPGNKTGFPVLSQNIFIHIFRPVELKFARL